MWNWSSPTDLLAIADAILYLLLRPTKAAERGRRGYEIAAKPFNWELKSCKLDELYKQLLDSNK